MNQYKLCILAAGKGIRLGCLTENFNKALLPINEKAIITHIIENHPKHIEIVVAVGYQGKKVQEYLQHAHPDRNIKCVFVENFEGEGSGPGHSLLCCKDELQCRFVMCTADTITELYQRQLSIQYEHYNWMGHSFIPYKDIKDYCTMRVNHLLGEARVDSLYDKIDSNMPCAFIGLACVYDYAPFWDSLESDGNLINAFKGLIRKPLHAVYFSDWIDTGMRDKYHEAKKKMEGTEQFDFSKANEYTYKVDGRLIKYFEDKDIVEKRYQRALQLGNMVPKITLKTDSFFSYDIVPGDVLYDCYDSGVTKDFLMWCVKNLWKKVEVDKFTFKLACEGFYKVKTKDRLSKFYMKYPSLIDESVMVNGLELPSLGSLLEKIDWEQLLHGAIPVHFHGDLQYDNVVKIQNGYKLIDWRQDFFGLDVGDLYYDFAKIYGGLTMPYRLIKDNKFEYSENNGEIKYNFETSNNLNSSREVFEKFVQKCNFDLPRIKLIRALIYLNMSPLHKYPFDKMLYYVARHYLNEATNEDNCI